MNLDEIELHDALINKINIDFVTGVVMIDVSYYETSEACIRRPALIKFNGAKLISNLCDFQRLQRNAGAGNVNYWVPNNLGGVTYIYLVDGCIGILSESVEVEVKG